MLPSDELGNVRAGGQQLSLCPLNFRRWRGAAQCWTGRYGDVPHDGGLRVGRTGYA